MWNCRNYSLLTPRLKQESERLWCTCKQHTASLQTHEASQTSIFPRDSIHPYIVILHPNWKQSCTASCQRVTNCRMQPHLSAGAARPLPQDPTVNTLYEQIKAMPIPSSIADFIILSLKPKNSTAKSSFQNQIQFEAHQELRYAYQASQRSTEAKQRISENNQKAFQETLMFSLCNSKSATIFTQYNWNPRKMFA